MATALIAECTAALDALRAEGLEKVERAIASPQGARIRLADGGEALNLCANNYLGLADHPALIEAARHALDSHGLGMASVRFICGTSDLHRDLETKLASYLGTADAILFPSCFDANGGLFEVLTTEADAVVSDALNHASIIDGIRLSKARRYRYANNDPADLERRLIEAKDARHRLIVTDGVFSMDGIVADLPALVDAAERHGALLVVDDCHATGFMGSDGSGTPAHFDLKGRVHVLTGTFGKALGGASGGYVAGPAPIVELLRQRARPYLFSNAIPPPVVAASLTALDIVAGDEGERLRRRLWGNTERFRKGLSEAGFDLVPGAHPIIPVMVGDAKKAGALAAALTEKGVYVTAFSYPVVPKGKARIRTQMSAALDEDDVGRAIEAFVEAGRATGLIG